MTLLPNERIDELKRANLRIIQSPGCAFTMDAVLLAYFASDIAKGRACDLGTGTGVIPLLLVGRGVGGEIDAVEIDPAACGRARRSVTLNGLDARIHVVEHDLRALRGILPGGAYGLVVCNPPYGRAGASLLCPDPARAKARHETDCTLDNVCETAAYLLKCGGRLAMVLPAHRLLEACDAMRAHRIEPKRLRFVHHTPASAPRILLLDGARSAHPGLHPLPPLILQDSSGAQSAEYREIYGE